MHPQQSLHSTAVIQKVTADRCSPAAQGSRLVAKILLGRTLNVSLQVSRRIGDMFAAIEYKKYPFLPRSRSIPLADDRCQLSNQALNYRAQDKRGIGQRREITKHTWSGTAEAPFQRRQRGGFANSTGTKQRNESPLDS